MTRYPRENAGRVGSLGGVADGFDVVAVGVAHERAVVGGVVLGPHAWLVEHFRAGGLRRFEPRVDRGAVRRLEGDVRLAVRLTGR